MTDHQTETTTTETTDTPADCPMCEQFERHGLEPLSEDDLAAARAEGRDLCGQCAEVVAENRRALA